MSRGRAVALCACAGDASASGTNANSVARAYLDAIGINMLSFSDFLVVRTATSIACDTHGERRKLASSKGADQRQRTGVPLDDIGMNIGKRVRGAIEGVEIRALAAVRRRHADIDTTGDLQSSRAGDSSEAEQPERGAESGNPDGAIEEALFKVILHTGCI